MTRMAEVLRLVELGAALALVTGTVWPQVPIWKEQSPAPAGARSPAMSFDSQRGVAVMFGGLTENAGPSAQTWEWDGNRWSRAVSSGPSGRYGHAMAYDSQRDVTVLFGGFDQGYCGDTWEWDGSHWRQVADNGPAARSHHAMAYDSVRGVTVMFGGSNGVDLGDTWEWDGNQWRPALFAPGPTRSSHSLAFDTQRGVTVLFGGESPNVLGDSWEWDGLSWTQVATTGPAPRSEHAMVYDNTRGVTVLFGGLDPSATVQPYGDSWEWDGTTWSQVASSGPGRRHAHAMAFDAQRNKTVLFGGYGGQPLTILGLVPETWEYDGASWADATPATAPSARRWSAMAYDSQRGVTVLFGGFAPNDTWEWDGSQWGRVATTGPSIRWEHSMAFDSQRGVTVLFGGNGPQDTWEWDGTAWSLRSTSGPASSGDGQAMAYDSQRGVAVLVGAQGTWEWDGTSWTQVSAVALRGRLAYDSQRGVTVLFGGSVGGGDTWEWDGTAWTQVATTGPSARTWPALAYDSQRGVTVLFGGLAPPAVPGSSPALADSWEWDGTTWSQVVTAGPSARFGSAMAYDSQREEVVLFGGGGLPQPSNFGDTWEFSAHYPSTARTFGIGCGSPRLELLPIHPSPPTVGTTARVLLSNIPTPQPVAFVALGWSNQTSGAFSLPLSLAGFGMPGCDLLQSADVAAEPVVGGVAGSATFSAAVPLLPGLLGLELHLQGWAQAPAANAAGVIVSNAVTWRFGDR